MTTLKIITPRMNTPRYWRRAVSELAQSDETLSRLIEQAPEARLRPRTDAFSALGRAIVGQQISVKAAQSVWTRVIGCVDGFAPDVIAAAEHATLCGAGLSRQKARYLQDLANHFASGSLDPARWRRRSDEFVIEDLTRVKGIGRWTAEMFLMFHLQRPDVLPVGDLGLQKAVSLHYNRGRPLTEKKLRKLAEPWAPWRTVATWYLWRSLDTIPVE
jgi:DNA-3-methyladenine glycosylase II